MTFAHADSRPRQDARQIAHRRHAPQRL